MRIHTAVIIPITTGTAPPTLLAQFAEAMEEVEFAPGSSIMTLGEPGEHLYVVTSGQVGDALLLLVFFLLSVAVPLSSCF